MIASRLPYLLMVLVASWFGATEVHATDPASPDWILEGPRRHL
jgi:hypothetical protein